MVFQQDGQSFETWYPDSLKEVFGKQNVGSLHGHMHKYLKNLVLSLFGSASIKYMLSEVENIATTTIERWVCQGTTVELKKATADMIFDLTARKLISYDIEKSSEINLRHNFEAFIKGLFSIPLPIPGTAFYKCLQGRKKVMNILKEMVKERRNDGDKKVKNDFLHLLLEEMERDETILTEEIALDMVFVLLFSSYETTSIAIVVAIKFLTENPRALKELTEEHEKILEKRENPESGLTWEEYKSMKFTFQVINESLRLANIVPGMFRKALTDVNFKGYTIPSGWVVMVCPPAVHLNPINYKDPLDFNPWRWEEMDFKGASKTFMAFGGGLRFCVGADFARLEMSIFLHCLVTKYRWQLVKGGETLRAPGLQFPNGFHVHISKKDE